MDGRFESRYPADSWKNEIEKLLIFVKGGNSSQIIGLPGVGRSNLLGVLAYNRSLRQLHLGKEDYKNFHFVLMNFSEVRKQELSSVLKFFFVSLIDSLSERSMEEEQRKVEEFLDEALGKNDTLILLQGLKKTVDYLSIEKGLTLIFLFDRFEEYIPSLSSHFFTSLRALRNRAKYKFSVIFSVSRALEDLIEKEMFVDFLEFLEGNAVYLPLCDEPSLAFRISFLEKSNGKNVPPEVLGEVKSLTAGHGKLTRLSIEAYFSEDTNVELAEFLLSENRVKGVLFEIWNSLSPSEQVAVMKKGFVDEAFLEKTNLVKNGEITIPLFEKYIEAEKNELSKEQGGKIELNASSGEIKKGEIVISDALTASEYKLLRFLIESSERVVSRDEAIEVVWQDSASTAGVTDQALDQLIFRLRKKVEQNPNNPNHLVTIKGRGFKFSP